MSDPKEESSGGLKPFTAVSLGRAGRRAAAAAGPFLGLVGVVFFFAFLNRAEGNYLSINNIKNIAVQTAIIGTCGIGMTVIIIGGGIDLSIGSTVALATIAVALVFNGRFFPTLVETVFVGRPEWGWLAAAALTLAVSTGPAMVGRPRWTGPAMAAGLWAAGLLVFLPSGGVHAVLAGIVVGVLAGIVNGALITATGVVPFIITLGTMTILRGAAQLLAKGESVGVDTRVLSDGYPWLYHLMSADPEPAWLLVGPGVWLMLLAGVATALFLRWTRWGRYVFAVGSNEQAARLSGVDVAAVKMLMYGGAGLATGLAGVMQFSRLAYGSSTASIGLELDVIAAVVIGGGSLRGGAGSILGTFLGASIMGFMRNGCDLAGIPNALQQVLIGAIIVLAVTLDELRQRRRR